MPVIHYQRSYLKFLDELVQEYLTTGIIDVSKRVVKRKANKKVSLMRQNHINSFCIKVQGFISDILVLFSDFDSSHE